MKNTLSCIFNTTLFSLVLHHLVVTCSLSLNHNPLILIISFDGFRYDYLDRNLTDTIVSFRNNGSYSPFLKSIFPTKTFPNHFSISTGLFTEVHGVLDNKVFDRQSNKTLNYGFDLFHYNKDIIPIWTLNEMTGDGRKSGCMMWPGCDMSYQNISPTYYLSYNGSLEFEKRIDTLVSWFTRPDKPINLGMLYFQQPDSICHSYGPDSNNTNKEIKHVNDALAYFLKKSSETDLLTKLNVILLSDHGGQVVKVPQHLIKLEDFVNGSWYTMAGVSPNLQIYPVAGKEEEVITALKAARDRKGNFSTYSTEDIPEEWHFKRCSRAPPIYISADVGYAFDVDNYTYTNPEIGTHGYDPDVPTMRGIFMAVGPAFKRKYEIQPFQNIHIYPLVAHLLGLSLPALKPNGSLSILEDILVSNSELPKESFTRTYIVIGALVCVAVTGLGCFIVCRHYRQKYSDEQKSSYRSPYSTFPATSTSQL